MRHSKKIGLLAVVAAATLAFAASASATVVTTTTGGEVETPTIHAVSENGHVTLANSIANIECSSTAEGKVESHGEEAPATGKISSLTFTGCTNGWHVTANAPGSLSVNWTSGYNGDLYSSGANVSTTRFGVTCNYETNNTTIGTVSGGNPATLNIEGNIPIAAGSSFLCGSGNAKWSGSYVTTAALFVVNAGLSVEPQVTKFKNVNEKKVLEIINPGLATIKNIEVNVLLAGDFKGAGTCNGKTLKTGEVCKETVESLKANKLGELTASSITPQALGSGELES